MEFPAPDHLSESARKAWGELVSQESVEWSGIESSALEAYAVQMGRMRDAQRRVDTEGAIVPDDKGRPVLHPALAIERMAQAEIRKFVERYRRVPKRSR